VDIPLLYETGHAAEFDRVVLTVCPVDRQVARLVERGMSEGEARLRIGAQMATSDKASRADFIIRTDGTFEETDRQVEDVFARLRGGGNG
jgi:dephospho-CoA kinase